MKDFDRIIDRSNTYSVKWSHKVLEDMFKNKDVLPMWVADMDFQIAKPIQEAIHDLTKVSIYGYSASDEANKALVNWMKKRHNCDLSVDEIINIPGVVFGINNAVQVFTNPGDKILIQEPVYPPFSLAITNNGREKVSNDLIYNGEKFEVDLKDFEEKVKDKDLKMFILCSPHNPSGKIFTKDELEKMLKLCYENGVLVVADEIHSDLIMPGNKYTSVLNINEKYYENLIICTAPSKSFNIPGLQWSAIIIKNEKLRERFNMHIRNLGYVQTNEISMRAVKAAYDESEKWLDDAIEYIYENYKYFKEEIEKHTEIKVLNMPATYLAFADFRAYDLSNEELDYRVFKKAQIGVNPGHSFGEQGSGFMRFNLACPRKIVEDAVERLIQEF